MRQKKNLFITLISLLLLITTTSRAETKEDLVKKILERSFGIEWSEHFILQIDTTFPKDSFECFPTEGNIKVIGGSPIALSKGAYQWMQYNGLSNISWEGNHTTPYSSSLVKNRLNGNCNISNRMYLNPCAYGYTTTWWDWTRWKKEIDWMALHGINTPVVLLGQEAVLQKIWNEMGIENQELENYFTGPAFLPWFRMGNIYNHAGPLPQNWIEREKELTQKISNYMHQLGMTPIIPSFCGFIPPAFSKKHPNSDIKEMPIWCGDNSNRSYWLNPKDPLFSQITKRFNTIYQEYYGTSNLYLIDAFNEMTPPVNKESKLDELAEYGEDLYKNLSQSNDKGVWVMQGWMFGNEKNFWSSEAIKAYLSKVPKDKVLILDYSEDKYSLYNDLKGFYGYNWAFGFVHNYGGVNSVYGALDFYKDNFHKVQSSPYSKTLTTYGLLPEGIENNSIAYEYAFDIPWQDSLKTRDQWISSYLKARYGKITPELERVWKSTVPNIYSYKYWEMRWMNGAGTYVHNKRPSLNLANINYPLHTDSIQSIIKDLIELYPDYKESEFYMYDLVEFTREYLARKADEHLLMACKAYKDSLYNKGDQEYQQAKIMLELMCPLLRHNNHTLSQWCKSAQKWGQTANEKELYLYNAKLQITQWGGDHLSDYASKEWDGLIKEYYIKRWDWFFYRYKKLHKESKELTQEIINIEDEFIKDTSLPSEYKKLTDSECIDLIKKAIAL